MERPTSNITRLFCSLVQRSYWKGSDRRNWLFYYGPLALKEILPARFYNHFLLYSEAVYTLSQKEIKFCEVRKAIEQLEKFVEDFELLYGIMNMTFNVHQLLHLGKCVYQWDPLWVYSTYPFENNNGNLLEMINGTQAVDIQIAKKFIKCQHLNGIARKYMDLSMNPELLQLQHRLLGEPTPTKKAVRCNNDCVLLGAATTMVMSTNEIRLVSNITTKFYKTTCQSYKKLLTQNNVLTIVESHLNNKKKKARRQNCIVLLKNGNLCSIDKIVLLESRDGSDVRVALFGKRLVCANAMSKTSKFQLMELIEKKEMALFFPNHVKSKCVYLLKNRQNFLAVLSNLIERD